MISKRYKPEIRLGQGSMGTVYLGTDTHTDTPVAIKHLNTAIVQNNPEMITRFLREGEMLRQLNHPNIVQMLDAIEEDGNHYLIMEYVPGGSLEEVLLDTPQQPIERVIQIGLELADALVRTHHLKIIHRDIKPANVLMASDGTPRLSDFGIAIARQAPRITESGSVVGSFAYLPPEGLRGDPPAPVSDLWSFGVLLFEMLTGRMPFPDTQIGPLMMAILNNPVPDIEVLRPDTPVGLVDLVYRLLEKDPRSRLSSARLVGAELEAISQGAASVIPPRQTPVPDPAPARTNPTPPPDDRPRNNLPTHTTPFIGREEELGTLVRMVNDPATRLITIIGPGGMGKTRLSLELAERYIEGEKPRHISRRSSVVRVQRRFPDGVFFVPLAPLNSAEGIIPAVAEAVDFQFYEGRPPRDQLLDFFEEKAILLVMDNFEHVLAGGLFVNDLLQHAPDVKVLVTSREKLSLTGESVFILSGMDFPEWETVTDALKYSAVQLFQQSATRVRPDFELTDEKLPAVARICRLVQGMPLGIVLAAAWIEMLSPQEIADEVSRNVDFLESDMQDIPERQRSIRAVFKYSWNLLSDEEKDALRKIAVFRGGFSRDAVQKITGAGLRTLITLVNKSLLTRNPEGRYAIHDLLRQFAAERLNTSPELRRTIYARHSGYYCTLLQQQTLHLKGALQLRALDHIDLEIENIRAAWQYAVEAGQQDDINRAYEGLFIYYNIRSQWGEGADAFQAALSALEEEPDTPPLLQAALLGRAGYFRFPVNRASSERHIRRIQEMYEQALDITRSQQSNAYRREYAFTLVNHAALQREFSGDSDIIRAEFEEAVDVFRSIDDQWGLGWSLIALASQLRYMKAFADARTQLQESRDVFREIGDQRGLATALFWMGGIERELGHYDEARQIRLESVSLIAPFDAPSRLALFYEGVGNVATNQGMYEEARTYYAKSYAIQREIGQLITATVTLSRLSYITILLADYEAAEAHIEECLRLSRRLDHGPRIAAAISNMGYLRWRQGDYKAACTHLEEALKLARQAEVSPARLTNILLRLGQPTAALGKKATARACYLEALQLSHENMDVRNCLEATLHLTWLDPKPQSAVPVLHLIAHHQNVTAEVKRMALAALDEMRGKLSAEAYEAAVRKSDDYELADVANRLLARG